jgi:hypothetical protein
MYFTTLPVAVDRQPAQSNLTHCREAHCISRAPFTLIYPTMEPSNRRRVSFAVATTDMVGRQADEDEIQPAAAASAAPSTSSRVSALRTRSHPKRKRDAGGPSADDNYDNSGAPSRDDDSESDDPDGGALSVAHKDSLVHDENAGDTAVTAFNLEDELNDGAIDPETGAFVPSQLRKAAAASPTHSVSSSDEDERAAEVAAKIRAAAARDEDDDEQDHWVENEENASRPAPAYEAPNGSGDGYVRLVPPVTKRPRAPDAVTASSPAAEKTEPELVVALAKVLEDGETAGDAIRRLKRASDLARLELVTELADGLMGVGVLSAYDLTRREVLARAKWDLSWGAVGGAGVMHGPFPAEKMEAWAASGFFSHPTKIGWVRPAPTCSWALASLVFRQRPGTISERQ